MFDILAVVIALFLLVFSLVLWRRGYHALNGDDEGTGIAHISAMVGFCVGLAGLLVAWHLHGWRQEPVLFWFFLFEIAVGAFQVGLASQALANGYVRSSGAEARGIAPSALYTLLLMPTGEAILRDDQPGRFWFETLSRGGMGLCLILFPALAPVYRLMTH